MDYTGLAVQLNPPPSPPLAAGSSYWYPGKVINLASDEGWPKERVGRWGRMRMGAHSEFLGLG